MAQKNLKTNYFSCSFWFSEKYSPGPIIRKSVKFTLEKKIPKNRNLIGQKRIYIYILKKKIIGVGVDLR
jgi:hypothetical protein